VAVNNTAGNPSNLLVCGWWSAFHQRLSGIMAAACSWAAKFQAWKLGYNQKNVHNRPTGHQALRRATTDVG